MLRRQVERPIAVEIGEVRNPSGRLTRQALPMDQEATPSARLRRQTAHRSITRTGARDSPSCSATAGRSLPIAGRRRCSSWHQKAIAASPMTGAAMAAPASPGAGSHGWAMRMARSHDRIQGLICMAVQRSGCYLRPGFAEAEIPRAPRSSSWRDDALGVSDGLQRSASPAHRNRSVMRPTSWSTAIEKCRRKSIPSRPRLSSYPGKSPKSTGRLDNPNPWISMRLSAA